MQHGYCVSQTSLQHHLCSTHRVKGLRLHAALAEAAVLEVRDPRQARCSSDGLSIPHLPVQAGFRWGVAACSQGRQFVSRHRRTVEKYLAKEHQIGHAKGKSKPASTDILEVSVQSFLPNPHYRAFVVRSPSGRRSSASSSSFGASTPHAADSQIRAELLETNERSLQSWAAGFDRLDPSTQLYVNQTPPSLRTTGISSWIAGLHADKKDPWRLIQRDNDGEPESSLRSIFLNPSIPPSLRLQREVSLHAVSALIAEDDRIFGCPFGLASSILPVILFKASFCP